jgi:Rieske Fe-S protein
MSDDDSPAWKDDFPISWGDDHYVTRREFTKSLVGVSCASFAATATLAAKRAGSAHRADWPELPLPRAGDLGVGAAQVFAYPGPHDRCILIRTAPDRFVAFGQKCTHLGCPVVYRAEQNDLQCPCHEGYFSALDGGVVSGPPSRGLARVALEQRGEELWAVGVEL